MISSSQEFLQLGPALGVRF